MRILVHSHERGHLNALVMAVSFSTVHVHLRKQGRHIRDGVRTAEHR